MNQNLQSLTELKEKIYAGSSALDSKEKDIVITRLVDNLSFIKEKNVFINKTENISVWTEIFDSIVLSGLAKQVMMKITPDSFYYLGEYYLNTQSEIPKEFCESFNRNIHGYLNLFRYSEFLKRVYGERRWDKLIYDLIIASNYRVKEMFDQRVRDYQSKTLFKKVHGNNVTEYSWKEVNQKVSTFAEALANNIINSESKVGFLMGNSLMMAYLDYACLTTGIVNVMLPANSVPQHIEFILNQTKAEILFVADEKQLSKVKSVRKKLKDVKKVVLLEGSSVEEWVITFDEFLSVKGEADKLLLELSETKKPESVSTIMYTSGTTGEPKGIIFKNKNLVYKRFCRAMALPEIGDEDRYLAYLPLFHTFGRYLELMGAIFWGAEYVFMENPAAKTMLANMQLLHPTIFISIPKKWMELYEHITTDIDIEFDDKEIILEAVLKTTGGKLKWGLSAAGYLPPEIFKFFQKYGIEVMSGFGMTEATGGITMTPPNEYYENSLGKALPGIEIKVADDGELLIRGNYVMAGYYNQPYEEVFDSQGWLPTGDIMTMDKNGFIEIIDRKKEIYKNIKGETIAPQRIENLFRDFDFIKQVFLVGDHRPFNTVLIYPEKEINLEALAKLSNEQLHEYYSSSVVTVNHFLAPYERIIDFKIIDRPFTAEKGELTPKGTYKRRIIEKNFDEIISTMYQKNHTEVSVNEILVRIPNWFLREKGCLSRDVIAENNKIKIPKNNIELNIQVNDRENNIYKIGDFEYEIKKDYIDLQPLLTNPLYWLGNYSLVEFTGEEIIQWIRTRKHEVNIDFHSKLTSEYYLPIKKVMKKIDAGEKSFLGLHQCLLLLQSENLEAGIIATKYLNELLKDDLLPIHKFAMHTFKHPELSPFAEIRKEMLKVFLQSVKNKNLKNVINIFINLDYNIIDDSIIKIIIELPNSLSALSAIENIAKSLYKDVNEETDVVTNPIPSILRLFASFGVKHPAHYKYLRRILVQYQIQPKNLELGKIAQEEWNRMRHGFRAWLGENQKVAIDQETGEEYTWNDVIILEESIDKIDKERLLDVIENTQILRETIFLISNGKQIRLNNILPGGIWISFIREDNYKKVFRVSVQTDNQGAFDFVLKLNKSLSPQEILEETNWLCLADSRFSGLELAGESGALWLEAEIWSGNFSGGETIGKFLDRITKRDTNSIEDRFSYLWPFFIWNAAALYFGFWQLTNKKLYLKDCTAFNFIIPRHDYQAGTRILSITDREKFTTLKTLFKHFYSNMVKETEELFPIVKQEKVCRYIFSGVIRAFGQNEGIKVLEQFRKEQEFEEDEVSQFIYSELNKFLTEIEEEGFTTLSLYFAIRRFHRWYRLNENADLGARAEMLQELYDTYQLSKLENKFPEMRTRFFFKTIFQSASEEFKKLLNNVVNQQRNGSLAKEEVLSKLSEIKSELDLTHEEDFFLTRLSYPHIRPSDDAVILKIQIEGAPASNLVVQYEDFDGYPFSIRKPISPKEISRLHQLFLEAKLLVNFNQEHDFLVALSERGFIIGGLFYISVDEETVYMDKIVVSNHYRRKGVSDKLMNELFNRMKTQNVKYITTGFFRPEYFYHFGFKIEKRYSGLVKMLS